MLHPIEIIFSIMSQGDFGIVYLGDNEPHQIIGKGRIKNNLQNGNQWLLLKVRHIPKPSRNIISIGQLGDEGCIVNFYRQILEGY